MHKSNETGTDVPVDLLCHKLGDSNRALAKLAEGHSASGGRWSEVAVSLSLAMAMRDPRE